VFENTIPDRKSQGSCSITILPVRLNYTTSQASKTKMDYKNTRRISPYSLSGEKTALRNDLCLSGTGCYAKAYEIAKSRNERRVLAAAMTALKVDLCGWARESSMKAFWLENSPPPTKGELEGSGAPQVIWDKISQGVLEAETGVWTGAFWEGLIDSGALRRDKARAPWTCKARLRDLPELEEDLRTAKDVKIIVGRVKDKSGIVRVRSVSSLQPKPGVHGASWFAGVLSGMTLVKRLGEWVLESREVTPRCLRWLEEAGVWHCGALGGGVWVSPFYLPLVASHCPPASGGRWERIKEEPREAVLGCEWLPLVTWEVTIGLDRHGHWPDVGWGLPWAPGHATRSRMGFNRRDAHVMALSRGIDSPALWLKELGKKWREEFKGV
jgi:hypothetical protein